MPRLCSLSRSNAAAGRSVHVLNTHTLTRARLCITDAANNSGEPAQRQGEAEAARREEREREGAQQEEGENERERENN